jgi:AraC family transcriptional regulator
MDQIAPEPAPGHAARIARTLRHVEAELAGDLSLDALADVAALSRFHFCRVFRAQTGEGVAEAVRRIRLNRAALLVVGTRDPYALIAACTGFGHLRSFERAFVAAFGATPAQVRRDGRIPRPLLPPAKGPYTMFPTEIREAEDTILAAVPHTGPYQEIGAAFGTLMQKLTASGLLEGSGPSYGLYYDDPSETPAEALRAHAGQRLAPSAEVPEGMDRVVLPGGRFLVCTCKGPFTRLPEAWSWTYARAIPEAGLTLRHAVPFEVYVTDTYETAPEDNVTEIWVPVE